MCYCDLRGDGVGRSDVIESWIKCVSEIHLVVVYNSTINENCYWSGRRNYTNEVRCGAADAIILNAISAARINLGWNLTMSYEKFVHNPSLNPFYLHVLHKVELTLFHILSPLPK